MDDIIIFGNSEIAQIANYYFENDSSYNVVAFTADEEFIKEKSFEGKEVIPFNIITDKYPPSKYKMFIALSYANMNKLRQKKYNEANILGYKFVSYISSRCSYISKYAHGENCFILENNVIQPFVKIGNNVTLWSGNHIGHHSEIADHNFISSHVVISGHCSIESNCFIGVNSTISHKVKIATETLVGAGAVISKDTDEKGIYVPLKSIKLDKNSDQIKL